MARLGYAGRSSQAWLLITTATPGDSSTLRVWAWRRLRSLGAHYLQQSVCLLPATATTSRAVNRVLARLSEEGGRGQALQITLSDRQQEEAVIETFQGERSDEYGEVVERTEEFHQELAKERARGRATYTELEESDADLSRHKKWLAAIEARDYFDAPGHKEAVAAVVACEQALADFEREAIASEMGAGGESDRDGAKPRGLRVVEGEGDAAAG